MKKPRRIQREWPREGVREWRWSNDQRSWTNWQQIPHAQCGSLHECLSACFVQSRMWSEQYGCWEIGPVSIDREWMVK
jgi:hypothetical protein